MKGWRSHSRYTSSSPATPTHSTQFSQSWHYDVYILRRFRSGWFFLPLTEKPDTQVSENQKLRARSSAPVPSCPLPSALSQLALVTLSVRCVLGLDGLPRLYTLAQLNCSKGRCVRMAKFETHVSDHVKSISLQDTMDKPPCSPPTPPW